MEVLLSTLLGEAITRSTNFFISKSSKLQPQDVEDRLQRVLLRAQVIIDEAMARQITNHAMLQQLGMLRDAMHQGHYKLDTFRYGSHKEETKDHVVSHYLSLSKLNSLKGFYSSNTNSQILEELQQALNSLSSMILDVEELTVFLMSYPRMYRQPYSMHLILGNCMFGRQMEAELVLSFLLHTHPNAAEQLEVLPLVGPGRFGKSTLVAHVCYDKRVRDHFSEIIFLSDNDLKSNKLTCLGEGGVKNQNSTLNKDGKMLVVIEATGDFNEEEWKRLCATCKQGMKSGSKIIITSRSDKITKLGTTRAVTLKHLSEEAYWYFFKTLVFGSTDPVMHPRLAHLAMKIARILKRCLFGATGTINLLRDNFDIHFWGKVVSTLTGFSKWHVSKFGDHPCDALNQNTRPVYLWGTVTSSEEIVVYHQYECSSEDKVPEISMKNVICGDVKPSGRFECLAFKSLIPPYYNYIYSCEIRDLNTTGTKRKRS